MYIYVYIFIYIYKCLTFLGISSFVFLRIHRKSCPPPPSRVAFRYQREQSCWSCSVSVVAICEPSRGKSEVFYRSWISSWIFVGSCGNIYIYWYVVMVQKSGIHQLRLVFTVVESIQVVPGRAGGGSFKRKKNYIAKKEFAYRMCARWPTIAMSKFFSEVWTKLLPLHGCHVMRFGVMCLWFDLLSNDVASCEVICGTTPTYYSSTTLYSVPQSTTPVLLCTTKYYSSTTLYYKVLLQYHSVLQSTPVPLCTTKYYSVLQSTTPVLQSTTPVPLCTTKYYSSTTLYYKVLQYHSVLQSTTPVLLCTTPVLFCTTKYYNVLLQYYSVLQSTPPVLPSTAKYYASTTLYYKVLQGTTPVLLCTIKYYSSTTKYYKVLQSTTPVLLCTTTYYSSTTLYYKVLHQYYSYYKVLRQYYPVLQSTTPVLLCTTQYYACTAGSLRAHFLSHLGHKSFRVERGSLGA